MAHALSATPYQRQPLGGVATTELETRQHPARTWLALMLLTVASFALGAYLNGVLLPLAVMLIALIKTGLVAIEFMGFGRVAGHWQWLMASYLVVLSVLLILAFV